MREVDEVEYYADHVVEAIEPQRRGWVRLTLTPLGLEAPALVVLTVKHGQSREPLAFVAVGPDRPVSRAVFLPMHDIVVEGQVYAGVGTVRMDLHALAPAQLLRGVKARLKGMRQLSLRAITERGIAVLRRMQGRRELVGMLPVDPVFTLDAWLDRYGTPSEVTIAKLSAHCEEGRAGTRVAIVDARSANVGARERTFSAIARQCTVPDDVITLDNDGPLSHESLEKLKAAATAYWIEAGEEPLGHAFLSLDAALRPDDAIAFADWLEVGRDRVQLALSAAFDPIRAATGFELRGAVGLRSRALSEVASRLSELPVDKVPRRGALLNQFGLALPEGAVRHIASPLTRVPESAPAALLPPARITVAERPSVSLVVPTHARAELLNRCVSSCFDRISGWPVELVVVDHASTSPAMAEALATIRQRSGTLIVREEGPFNYSRLVNVGVARSKGEVLVLLNDDVEAMTRDWLDGLVTMLQKPGIGVVGPRLLYPDGRIQHNGVALGMGGIAGHPGRGAFPTERNQNRVDPWPRTVSAVTGACLLIRRVDFDAVGGLDENLAVEFNDVDLCLRVAARGLKCVLEPRVTLTHHEQATRTGRPQTLSPARKSDRITFVNRWGSLIADDPWLSPNIALEDDSCALADPPRSRIDLTPRRRVLKPVIR
jgi:GT2 family glycosyltransferase